MLVCVLIICFFAQDQGTISIWQKISPKCHWNHFAGFFVECCLFHFLHGGLQLFQCLVCLLHNLQHHWIWRYWHFCKFSYIIYIKCLMPCPFIDPKMFLAAWIFLCQTKNFIYVLWQSQTFCTRQKDDFHSVELVFVPTQKFLKRQ